MIATPIGNLDDLGTRAREALQSADEIWCEDTRHTRKLLAAIGAESRILRRVDQHTSDRALLGLLEQVQEERKWIGVVTDAGTPGLSDPGARILQLLPGEASLRVEPIPGPSALSALVSVSGFSGNSFEFQGFFPRSASEAFGLLDRLRAGGLSPNWIFFESPHRIRDAARILAEWCGMRGVRPRFVFAKELTKLHERILRGQGEEFLKALQDPALDVRGEWVFGVILAKEDLLDAGQGEAWELALDCLLEAGISPRVSAPLVASRFSVAKNLAYRRALESKKK